MSTTYKKFRVRMTLTRVQETDPEKTEHFLATDHKDTHPCVTVPIEELDMDDRGFRVKEFLVIELALAAVGQFIVHWHHLYHVKAEVEFSEGRDVTSVVWDEYKKIRS